MNRMKIATALTAVLIFAPQLAFAEPGFLKKQNPEDKKAPLHVTSDRMISDNKKQLISFFGTVIAIKGKLTVESDEMYVWTTKDQSDVTEMEALGSVRITRPGRVATGDKAHYYADKQQIILTGSPVLTKGKDVATGEKVIYYFDTEDMEIFGGEKKRSTLVLYPKEKQEDTAEATDAAETSTEPEQKGTRNKESSDEIKPAAKKTGVDSAKNDNDKTDKVNDVEEPPGAAEGEISDKKSETDSGQPAPVILKQSKPAATKKTSATPEKKLDPSKPVLIAIQVGSYRNLKEAVELRNALREKGYTPYVLKYGDEEGVLYRVRLGGYKTMRSAKRMAKQLKEKEGLETALTQYQP